MFFFPIHREPWQVPFLRNRDAFHQRVLELRLQALKAAIFSFVKEIFFCGSGGFFFFFEKFSIANLILFTCVF